jgi:hypothetical protein
MRTVGGRAALAMLSGMIQEQYEHAIRNKLRLIEFVRREWERRLKIECKMDLVVYDHKIRPRALLKGPGSYEAPMDDIQT